MGTRWSEVAGEGRGEAYDRRFAALAVAGEDVHGEATFCAGLRPSGRILDAGCGTGRVALELARRGYQVVGTDVDPAMLAVARRAAPELTWLELDLALLDPRDPELGGPFDIVVAAGNVLPLLSAGTEHEVVRRLAGCLPSGGLLVAGFGLDPAHLPLPQAPLTLSDYDCWCEEAGLSLTGRFATWAGAAYSGGGYAVSVHEKR